MHYYLWHSKNDHQHNPVLFILLQHHCQDMTSSFLSSHGGGFDITRSQKLGQRGVHGSNKVNFLGSKFGGTQKVVGKFS
jgi:hypothetical protein